MAETPVFRESDRDNVAFVRDIVLCRLKHDIEFTQMDYQWTDSEGHVCYGDVPAPARARLRARFIDLANEVMWQLIAQGVITPGNESQPFLPFFRLTDYGRKVLEKERFIPHDPTGYLDGMRAAATATVGQVAIFYIEEALRCFTTGCHVASVLLLGVAAESVFLDLCGVVRSSLRNAADQAEFDKLPDSVKAKHRWIVKRYENLPPTVRRKHLPESLDMTLTSLYEMIRRQRNELGHPQDNPPDVDREQAFVYFQLFPRYVTDVEAFARYCRSEGT